MTDGSNVPKMFNAILEYPKNDKKSHWIVKC